MFSSQLVFVDSGFIPNRDFFEEQVAPRDIFLSPYSNIYFLGGANSLDIEKECFFINSTEETQRQSISLAKMLILGVSSDYTPQRIPVFEEEKYLEELLQQVTLSSEQPK